MRREVQPSAQAGRPSRWKVLLGVLVMNAVVIAWVVAIKSGVDWLLLVYRFLVLAVGAAFVFPVCADTVSQARSNRRRLAGREASKISLGKRLLIYVLTFSPALFGLVLLGEFVRSWFMLTVIGEISMLLFLLLIGPR